MSRLLPPCATTHRQEPGWNIVIPADTPGLASEYEALTADLGALCPGSLAGLEENNGRRDITYLAGKSGWDARAVAMASLAAQLSQAQPAAGIHPAFYYALFRAGLAADPGTLYRTQPASLERIWAQSISRGVIPRNLQEQIPAAVRGFTSVRAASVITAPPLVGVSSLGDLLTVTFGEGTESHRRFADIYAGCQGDPAQMWAQVDEAFGAQTGARLRLTGQLAYLTVNNGPLISALFQAAGDTPIRAASDLAAGGYHKAESWLPLISQTTVPAQIPGSGAEEKAANYADLLAAQVRLSFPTAVMGQLVQDGTVPVLGGAGLQAAVAGFLTASHEEFDIGGEPIVRYLARTGIDSGLEQAAIDQITRVQRVYQMTQDSQALAGLLRAGIDWAYAVTRHTQAAFRTAFADTVGGEDAANAVYAQARTIHGVTLSLTLGYLGARLAPGSAQEHRPDRRPAGRPRGRQRRGQRAVGPSFRQFRSSRRRPWRAVRQPRLQRLRRLPVDHRAGPTWSTCSTSSTSRPRRPGSTTRRRSCSAAAPTSQRCR